MPEANEPATPRTQRAAKLLDDVMARAGDQIQSDPISSSLLRKTRSVSRIEIEGAAGGAPSV